MRLLQADDPLKDAPYIAAAELSGGRDGRNDAVQLGAALSLSAIKTHLAAEIREEVAVFWAPASKVRGATRGCARAAHGWARALARRPRAARQRLDAAGRPSQPSRRR